MAEEETGNLLLRKRILKATVRGAISRPSWLNLSFNFISSKIVVVFDPLQRTDSSRIMVSHFPNFGILAFDRKIYYGISRSSSHLATGSNRRSSLPSAGYSSSEIWGHFPPFLCRLMTPIQFLFQLPPHLLEKW